jgi:hypothetical protein
LAQPCPLSSLTEATSNAILPPAAWAADVWVSKPWTDWSDRDIRKTLTDSPWARGVSIELAYPRRLAPAGAGIAEGAGGNLGVGQARNGPPPAGGQLGPPEANLIIRWQSSPVIQQAQVKAQYGANAATSPEAQKRLEPNGKYYLIAVANLPISLEPAGPEAKAALLAVTTLAAKDKGPIVAQDVLFVQNGAGVEVAEARFLFLRSVVFTAEDKQAEFASKFGKISVKARFLLRDMLVGGKLEL